MMKLSPREREVLLLFTEEGRMKPVAEALGRSVHTVQSHKSSIMRKLHAKNSIEMIRSAIRKGLVKP
jgi:DNA-binding NarL/FixJ family response regulator